MRIEREPGTLATVEDDTSRIAERRMTMLTHDDNGAAVLDSASDVSNDDAK